MNRQFEQRLRKLEMQRKPPLRRRKSILPRWLLDRWHQKTGLPFDNDEIARKSIWQMLRSENVEKRRLQETKGSTPPAAVDETLPREVDRPEGERIDGI